jgi:stearoyl-CoA desaturase (delta-9 desaturase)
VNSLAHWLGEATYDDHNTPRDHWFTGFITMGEGYHNFHHQFPQDYRSAIKTYQWDPTKWLISILSFLGLAYELKRVQDNEITKGRLWMKEKEIAQTRSTLQYGTELKDLPIYSWEEFQSLVLNNDKNWVLIEGVLYDVKGFEHPGGKKLIQGMIGKDATSAFNGGVYNHSNYARNLLTLKRVGVLKNGMQVMAEDDPEYRLDVKKAH